MPGISQHHKAAVSVLELGFKHPTASELNGFVVFRLNNKHRCGKLFEIAAGFYNEPVEIVDLAYPERAYGDGYGRDAEALAVSAHDFVQRVGFMHKCNEFYKVCDAACSSLDIDGGREQHDAAHLAVGEDAGRSTSAPRTRPWNGPPV